MILQDQGAKTNQTLNRSRQCCYGTLKDTLKFILFLRLQLALSILMLGITTYQQSKTLNSREKTLMSVEST